MSVRRATTLDFPLVLPLLRLAHAESVRASMTFDVVAVHSRFDAICENGIVGVIDGPRYIEASVGLRVAHFWDSRENHLEDLWAIVRPEHRRSDHAKQLMVYAKGISDEMGLRLILAQLSTPETEPKIRLLERTMTKTGVIFCHEPTHA